MDNKVIIIDIKMPFMSMITFMVKWVIAIIPAIIVLVLIFRAFIGILV